MVGGVLRVVRGVFRAVRGVLKVMGKVELMLKS